MADHLKADAEIDPRPLLGKPLAKAAETSKSPYSQRQGPSFVPRYCTQNTCKPELISIGPYYRKEPSAGTENSVKEKFQQSFFGKNEELKEQCRKKLRILAKDARRWYAKNTIGLDDDDDINNDDKFVEMLLLDGCFILEFLSIMHAGKDALKNIDDKEVVQTIHAFMRVGKKQAQTLSDMLLFKSQIPFFILIELHKLKSWNRSDAAVAAECIFPNNDPLQLEKFMTMVKENNGNALQKKLNELEEKYKEDDSIKQVNVLVKECKYEALLEALKINNDGGALLKKLMQLVVEYKLVQDLMVMVKKQFVDLVPKLTPHNVAAHEYRPKHILQLVHSLCIPRHDTKTNDDDDHSCGNTEQINTATELEQDGVRFTKIGKVYEGFSNKSANDETTLFDIDFARGILKIPCFKIDDSTETFFRSMMDYEEHSGSKQKYFTDFAWCMGQLIRSQNDVNLLRRRGIIINLLATDDMVAKMFNKMCEGAVISNTFSALYTKVNRFGQWPWNIWWGKLAQDFYYSPWKLISTIVGALILSLGTAVSIKNLLK